MTLYEDSNEVFAPPRPSGLALAVTSFCLLMLTAQFTTLLLSLGDALLALYSDWEGEWFLYAPLADSFRHGLFRSPPAMETYKLAGPVIAAGSAIVAFLLIYMWPSEQSLASRLSVYTLATNLLMFGPIAIGFEPDSFNILEERNGVDPLIARALAILIGLMGVMFAERKTIEMTTNVFTLTTAMKRLGWWLVRLLPGLAVLGALSFLNDYRAGALAVLSVVAITLLENLTRTPPQRFTALQQPRMRVAAALLPLVLVVVAAASVWLFGMRAAQRPRRLVVLTRGREVQLESLAVAREKRRPVFKIHWSKDRPVP